MRIISFILLLICVVSCTPNEKTTKEDNNSSLRNEIDSIDKISPSKDDSIKIVDTINQTLPSKGDSISKNNVRVDVKVALPYGNDSLIKIKFPKRWNVVFAPTANSSYSDRYTNSRINIQASLVRTIDSTVQLNSTVDTLFQYKEQNASINYYDTTLNHVFSSILSPNRLNLCATMITTENYSVYLFNLPYTTPRVRKYRSEGDDYIYRRVDIASINHNDSSIIDNLNIYNYVSWSYMGGESLFYIDKNMIIHIKSFAGNEEATRYLRYEKWQIKSNGKFVRFYEKDDYFKNEEEQGTVKNSMREGKWIEKKPNGWVEKKTYLESYFKEGEPIGEWKFYDYTGEQKGKLLYTESYENGELVERKFVE